MGILDDAIREHLELKRKHGVPEDEVERQEEEALGPARRDVAQQPDDAEIAADAGDDASLFDGEHRDAPVAEAPALADDETVIAEPPPAEHAPAHEEPQAEPFAEESPEAEPAVADHTGMEPPLAEAEPAEPTGPPAAEVTPEPPEPELPPEPAEPDLPPEPAEPELPPEPPAAELPPEPPAHEAPPEPDPHESLGDTEPHGFPALEDDELPEDDALEDDVHEDPVPGSDAEDDELDVLEDTPDFLQETPEHDRLWFEQKPPRDFDFD